MAFELEAYRARNISWSWIVAVLAFIVRKKTQFDYKSLGIFDHLFQGYKTEKCRSYNSPKRIGFSK